MTNPFKPSGKESREAKPEQPFLGTTVVERVTMLMSLGFFLILISVFFRLNN